MADNEEIKYVSEEGLDYIIETLSKLLSNSDFELEDGMVTPEKLADTIGIIANGGETPTDTTHYSLWLDYIK